MSPDCYPKSPGFFAPSAFEFTLFVSAFRPRETVHLAAELPPPATDKEYTGQVKLGGKPVKDLGAQGPSKRHPWDPYDSREWG